MSATGVSVAEITDPELISRVRDGDIDAYGTLFGRHVDAATRLARMLVGGPDADDLVSDAFVKVLNVLLGGGGPDVAFRAYLLTAVRRLHVDKIRSNQRLTTTGDMTPFDPGVPFTDTAVAGFEGGAAAKAFASLPERWQMVLWHLEVENQKPAEIAPLLGMSANSVSALAYRAREGLRQAFLNMHSGELPSEECRENRDLLGAYVRGGLSRRDTVKVEEHLEHCRPCTAVYLELVDVNSSLAGLLAPALLGAAAAGYLGTGAAGGVGLGVVALFGRARDLVLANGQVAAAGLVAVGVAGVATLVVVTGGPDDVPASAGPSRDPGRTVVDSPDPTVDPVTRPRGLREGALLPPTRSPAASPSQSASAPGSPTASPTRSVAAAAAAVPPSAANAPTDARPREQVGEQPGEQVGGQPGPPKNVPTTKPSTRPDPTKPPASSPPPSPPPPEPPPAVADVRISASLAPPVRNRVTVSVLVLGVPAGSDATMRITSDRGNLRRIAAPGCSGGAGGYTCRVGPLRALFVFDHNNASSTRLAIEVSAADGFRDPAPGNNTAVLRLLGR